MSIINISDNDIMTTTLDSRIQRAYILAYNYESTRGSCPQCVLASLFEVFHVASAETIQSIDGLSGGTSSTTDGTCGALVGGIVALSFLYGRSYDSFKRGTRERNLLEHTQKLTMKFKEKYGGILCKEVHQQLFGRTFNFFDTTDCEAFEKAGAHKEKCPCVTGDVALWTAEILVELINNKKTK